MMPIFTGGSSRRRFGCPSARLRPPLEQGVGDRANQEDQASQVAAVSSICPNAENIMPQ